MQSIYLQIKIVIADVIMTTLKVYTLCKSEAIYHYLKAIALENILALFTIIMSLN